MEKQVQDKGRTPGASPAQRVGLPSPSKIAQSKVYDYMKKMYVDGLPRVRAYAEAIDDRIYQLSNGEQINVFTYFREARKDWNDIKEMVMAEQAEWSLRRSAALQDKAVNLLSNLMDKANELATKPEADVKELNAAISTLKTIMPAFTATVSGPKEDNNSRKLRAGNHIH